MSLTCSEMKSGPMTFTFAPFILIRLPDNNIRLPDKCKGGPMRKAKKRVVTRAEDMSGYLVKRAQSIINLSLEEIVSKHGLRIPTRWILAFLAKTPGSPKPGLA